MCLVGSPKFSFAVFTMYKICKKNQYNNDSESQVRKVLGGLNGNLCGAALRLFHGLRRLLRLGRWSCLTRCRRGCHRLSRGLDRGRRCDRDNRLGCRLREDLRCRLWCWLRRGSRGRRLWGRGRHRRQRVHWRQGHRNGLRLRERQGLRREFRELNLRRERRERLRQRR